MCQLFFADKIDAIEAFAQNTPYTDIVLLGMGGSSLVSEVFLHSIAPIDSKKAFYVVDTTDAQALADLTQNINTDQTLFIVASKSGTTLEVKTFSNISGISPAILLNTLPLRMKIHHCITSLWNWHFLAFGSIHIR